MIRLSLFLALIGMSTAAAAGIGPQIGYSVGRDLYLVNPDGSGKRLLYRGGVGTTIFSISMKKDGGQVSFEEVASNGQTARLITLSYGNSGNPTVLRSIQGCRFHVDTRDDGAILAVDYCDGILKYSPSPNVSLAPIGTPGRVSKVSWMSDGTFLYAANARIYWAAPEDPVGSAIRNIDCVQDIAAANNARQALTASACLGPRIDRMEVPSGASVQVGAGPDAAYSQDDRCFISVSSSRTRGAILLITRISGGNPVQFGNVADYKAVDWRGDSLAAPCPIASP